VNWPFFFGVSAGLNISSFAAEVAVRGFDVAAVVDLFFVGLMLWGGYVSRPTEQP